MDICILAVGSVSRAIRARRLLSAARIPARLVKTVQEGMEGGCVYGLEIAATDMPRADEIFRQENIPYTWSRPTRGR